MVTSRHTSSHTHPGGCRRERQLRVRARGTPTQTCSSSKVVVVVGRAYLASSDLNSQQAGHWFFCAAHASHIVRYASLTASFLQSLHLAASTRGLYLPYLGTLPTAPSLRQPAHPTPREHLHVLTTHLANIVGSGLGVELLRIVASITSRAGWRVHHQQRAASSCS